MLADDSLKAALPSVKYLNDKRFRHFYDPDQSFGKEIARSVGWEGHVAWDIYLFYRPQAVWKALMPEPTHWMHQLEDSWADKTHFHTGDGLVNAFLYSMTTFFE